jgi:hypothetical protein
MRKSNVVSVYVAVIILGVIGIGYLLAVAPRISDIYDPFGYLYLLILYLPMCAVAYAGLKLAGNLLNKSNNAQSN